MKNLKFLLTAAVTLSCLLACFAGLAVTSSAEAEFAMEIPYGHPTVDGVIEEGEYAATYVMDRKSAAAWVGEVGSSKVTWHLAWDEGGLYYAGTINDKTPTWRDENSHWVGIDCLELAVNPGLILDGDRAEGIFFSCGSMKDGSVVVYRHNFADGLVSDEITGANKGHVEDSTSYTMEIYLPWSLVQIDEYCTVGGKDDIHLDSTGWKAEAGAQLGLLPCAIDSRDAEGRNIIAYKFNGTDFIAKDFIVATLVNADGSLPGEETSAQATEPVTEPASETSPGTDAVSEEPTAPATDVPAGTSPEGGSENGASDTVTGEENSGCAGTLTAGLAVLLLPPAWLALRKRER